MMNALALASSLWLAVAAVQTPVPEPPVGEDGLQRYRDPIRQVEDGIYVPSRTGEGPRVRLNNTGELLSMGERLAEVFGEATLHSVTNDNTLYMLSLRQPGPLPEGLPTLVIDAIGVPVSGRVSPDAEGIIGLRARVHGEWYARRIARRLGIEPHLREHPGHQLTATWTPDKRSYRVGDTITLTMEIRNVGNRPVSFRAGGQQRGGRDNQFRFLAHRSHGHGTALPDTGDPRHFGGLSSRPTLQPGETFTRSVELNRWFDFNEANTYRITGIYELDLYDPTPGRDPDAVAIWSELIAGECMVRIVAAE